MNLEKRRFERPCIALTLILRRLLPGAHMEMDLHCVIKDRSQLTFLKVNVRRGIQRVWLGKRDMSQIVFC